jgi:deoxyribose-phosphate aldolase
MIERLRPAARRAVVEAGGAQLAILRDLGRKTVPSTAAGIATTIDHTLLKPGSTPVQIDRLCAEALEYHFAAVCVNPQYVSRVADALAGSGIGVSCAVGFPLGATTPEAKAVEAEQAVQAGANEIDMVIDLGHLKSGDYRDVALDISNVVRRSHERRALVKVILETGLLTQPEKVAGCLIAAEAGADFVKTSTGFGPGGATPEDVSLLRRVVGPSLGVKAAGGIRSYSDAHTMLLAGATRLGTSSGVEIVKQAAGLVEIGRPPASGY